MLGVEDRKTKKPERKIENDDGGGVGTQKTKVQKAKKSLVCVVLRLEKLGGFPPFIYYSSY